MLLSVFVIFFCSVAADEASTSNLTTIITEVPHGKYPYVVFLRYNDTTFCSGSIISDRFVLTTARCVANGEPEDFTVTDVTGAIHPVEQIFVHDDYQPSNLVSVLLENVALVVLREALVFDDVLQLLDLTDHPVDDFNRSVIAIRWAAPLSQTSPNVIQERNTYTILSTACLPEEDLKPTPFLCTNAEDGHDYWEQDTGTPLIADGVQIGMLSFSMIPVGSETDVFIKIYPFLDWIHERLILE